MAGQPVKAQTQVYLPLVAQPVHKLGMAGCPASCVQFGCAWCYNWKPNGNVDADYEFVPMIGDRFDELPELPTDAVHGLLFNEPDLDSQANLSPQEAAELAHRVFEACPNLKWGAPAPSQVHPEWIDAWFEVYRELYGAYPPVKFLTMHCYLGTAQACITLAEAYHERLRQYGLTELWVTEFGFRPEWPNAKQEARTFAAWMEAQDWITRYAPYVSYTSPDEPVYGRDAPLSVLNADLMTVTPVGAWYAMPFDRNCW